MNSDRTNMDRLVELASAIFEGEATPEQVAELDALLLADSAVRDEFLDLCRLHAELGFAAKSSRAAGAAMDALDMAMERDDAEGDQAQRNETQELTSNSPAHPLAPAPQSSRITWANYLTRHNMSVGMAAGLLFVVAVLTWAAMTYLPGLAKKDEHADDKAKYVALLNRQYNVTWLDGTQPAPNRPRLMPGQRLAFGAGRIEIRYRTGAQVVIEGPAEFYVGGKKAEGTEAADKNNSGHLDLGSLVARCETRASKSFTIATPNARVEDFGTEFGVNVNERGAAEVVVLSGEVEVIRDASETGSEERVRLRKDQGATITESGKIARRTKVDVRLVAQMRSRLQKMREADVIDSDRLVAYWPLNDGKADSAVTGADDVIDDPSHPATDAIAAGKGGTWVEDATRGIVLSTTKTDHLDAGTQGIAGDFTWSLWIKTTELSGSVVMGNRSGGGGGVGAGGSTPWNKLMTNGFHGLAVVNAPGGDWQIADGRWHHMAVRRSGSTVSVHIDGVQSGSGTSVATSCNGSMRIGGDSIYDERVLALISDVAVWNRALTNARIRALAAGGPVILASKDSAAADEREPTRN